MKWFFKLLTLTVLLSSCETQSTLKVDDYLVAKSRNAYLIIDTGSFDFTIQEKSPSVDDPEVHLVYPLISSESEHALTALDGIAFDTPCSLEPWLLEGEKMDIRQSKVAYQRALVKKKGRWHIIQCQGKTEVSAYTFRDEMLEWGATSVIKLEYLGANMGWYRYGGANIEKKLDLEHYPQPTAFLVVN